jgi:hypothetical protein
VNRRIDPHHDRTPQYRWPEDKLLPPIPMVMTKARLENDTSEPLYRLFHTNCQFFVAEIFTSLEGMDNRQSEIKASILSQLVHAEHLDKFKYIPLPWNPTSPEKMLTSTVFANISLAENKLAKTSATERQQEDTSGRQQTLSLQQTYNTFAATKRIIVQAMGGYGKTILSKKIPQDWHDGCEELKDFDMIFRLDIKAIKKNAGGCHDNGY